MAPPPTDTPTTWPELIQWGQTHYRDRLFPKDTVIPTRPGLLYCIHQGAVRLTATAHQGSKPRQTLIALYRTHQSFEMPATDHFEVIAQAHLEPTSVIWLYWREVAQWPHLLQLILQQCHSHQKKQLLWLSLLGQPSTLDRLLQFLLLLLEDGGLVQDQVYFLPYPLTHGQIGSAIGATRVTVTRLMIKLRQQGVLTEQDNRLGLHALQLHRHYALRLIPHLEPLDPLESNCSSV